MVRNDLLDDLSSEAAVAVLRGWGVTGDELALRDAATQVGNHALSVAVIGSFLRSFADGDVAAVREFNLEAVSGAESKATKLTRVLAYYVQRLPDEERELLSRLSVFSSGVTLEMLNVLIDAGGEVAGALLNSRPKLASLLESLQSRPGLVFSYHNDALDTWSAHPFLRDAFRRLLRCPTKSVFDAVALALGAGLDARPADAPLDTAQLDRFEGLIEATRLAGRGSDAFGIYVRLGGYGKLGRVLGEYQRGRRILAAFSESGRPEDLGRTLSLRERLALANDLEGYARHLGRLAEARALSRLVGSWLPIVGSATDVVIANLNSAALDLSAGELVAARQAARSAFHDIPDSRGRDLTALCLAHWGRAAHLLGDKAGAESCFGEAAKAEPMGFVGTCVAWHALSMLDLGRSALARQLAERGLADAARLQLNHEIPALDAVLARVDLAEGRDPTGHIAAIRAWTAQTGDMEPVIEARLLSARYQLACGDAQSAIGEAEAGLNHAIVSGYALLRIELHTTIARIRLAWPDPPRAIQAAREALDLATAPECQYAWGEADAAQLWGEAYFANNEPELARRAFEHARTVRARIGHPAVDETDEWLRRIE